MKLPSKEALYFAVVLLAATATWPAASSRAAESASELSAATSWATNLEGKKFRSRQFNDDGTARPWDVLLFKDGKFISENCIPFGFVAGPYWLRLDGDRVHFLAELESPTHGTMVWKGTVTGEKIEGNLLWTRERWYWTIRRSFNFSGELEN